MAYDEYAASLEDHLAKQPGNNLTDKQRRFCHEYLKDFNATAAYRRAGYSAPAESTARSNASKLLTNSNIQAYLEKLRSQAEKREIVSLERVLQETARIAFSKVSEAVDVCDGTVSLKSFEEIDDDTLRAIESVKETRDGRSIKFHAKQPALESLMKFFGAYSDLNIARATLKRYGLALEPDPSSDTGWSLEKHVIDQAASTSPAETDQVSED